MKLVKALPIAPRCCLHTRYMQLEVFNCDWARQLTVCAHPRTDELHVHQLRVLKTLLFTYSLLALRHFRFNYFKRPMSTVWSHYDNPWNQTPQAACVPSFLGTVAASSTITVPHSSPCRLNSSLSSLYNFLCVFYVFELAFTRSSV